MPETFERYLETAAAEIHYRRARVRLMEELAAHLEDQRDACLRAGMDEAEAEQEAVRQMGDPAETGAQLNRLHRPVPQRGLLVFAVLLLIAGALLRSLLAAGTVGANWEYDGMSVVLGAAALAAGYFLDVGALGRRGIYVYGVLLAGLWAASWFGPGAPHGQRWFANTMLPILYPAALALFLWPQRGTGWRGVLLSLLGVGLGVMSGGRLSASSAFAAAGSALALGIFFASQDWFGVGKKRGMGITLLLGVGMLGGFLWLGRDRLAVGLFPERFSKGAGFYGFTVRETLRTARWLGPAEHVSQNVLMDGDSLLAALICRFGWLPFLAVLVSFGALFLYLIGKTARLQGTLGKAVCLGGLFSLLFQAAGGVLLNVGISLIPQSFPLVVGNWNSVMEMFLIGMMLSVFRDGMLPDPAPAPAGKRLPLPTVSYQNRTLTISF